MEQQIWKQFNAYKILKHRLGLECIDLTKENLYQEENPVNLQVFLLATKSCAQASTSYLYKIKR